MEKHKAIPKGYMTVGQIAKKMDVTVRTLQYYDREGVLLPSAQSEGGRRLYTDKDMVKLHQILSMKYLGFSLEDIKTRLISLDTPADVADALAEHAIAIRGKIEALLESLQAIEVLQAEVLQMQYVDFAKYANIITSLQMKNEMYWAIKHFDDDMLSHIRNNFDKEDGLAIIENFKQLTNEAAQLCEDGVSPESDEGQSLANSFWQMITDFTGGNMSMLPKLAELSDKVGDWDGEFKRKFLIASGYIQLALNAYFKRLGHNPFDIE